MQSNNQGNRYPYVPYGKFETQEATREEPQRVEDGQPINMNVNPIPNMNEQQQQQQMQYPPVYYIPVQGPNGLMYVPAGNQFPGMQGQMPIQAPMMNNMQGIPQAVPQGIVYGVPMMNMQQPRVQEPDCCDSISNYFTSMTPVDKYRFYLNVLSVFALLGLLISAKGLFHRHCPGVVIGLILSIFYLITLRKGVCAIKRQDPRAFKRFLRMAAVFFVICVYNIIMVLAVGPGFRRIGGLVALTVLSIMSGSVVCRGRRLFKNVIKAQWRRGDVENNVNHQ